MLVLALDTSARTGALALARDGEIIAASRIESPEGLASVLFQEIQALLAEKGLKTGDVDLWSPSSGPGSFTGIRVGMTAAKALAEVHGKGVVPISNLDALAAAAPAGRNRAAVLDARREEVYGAVYGPNLEVLVEPAAWSWAHFQEAAAPHNPLWACPDAAIFCAEGAAPLGADAERVVVPNAVEGQAKLAFSRPALPPEQVEAEYIRRPDAERNLAKG